MRGVMHIGIKDGVGFSVNMQDIDPLVEETMPICGRALLSFTLVATAGRRCRR
jgi:hypothetical protein